MKKRNWLGSGAFEGKADIKDKEGKLLYKLKGKWN